MQEPWERRVQSPGNFEALGVLFTAPSLHARPPEFPVCPHSLGVPSLSLLSPALRAQPPLWSLAALMMHYCSVKAKANDRTNRSPHCNYPGALWKHLLHPPLLNLKLSSDSSLQYRGEPISSWFEPPASLLQGTCI